MDLDFWFVRRVAQDDYYTKILAILARDYEITDFRMKHYTLLFELRSGSYSRRLKIEIRRRAEDCDFQAQIAFSRFSTKQVVLRTHTLNQTMKNKIDAFLDRGEIRDCFDIEFLLRRGIEFPALTGSQYKVFHKKLARFKDKDFKVMLDITSIL